MFNHKPYLVGGLWCPDRDIDEYGEWPLDFDQFPEVTFENSPMEVELVIKSQNKVTECHNCHEVIKFTENDVIDGWYVKCPCCEEEISILL
jgi:formylmethanofuran dehydrogenase subunit E